MKDILKLENVYSQAAGLYRKYFTLLTSLSLVYTLVRLLIDWFQKAHQLNSILALYLVIICGSFLYALAIFTLHAKEQKQNLSLSENLGGVLQRFIPLAILEVIMLTGFIVGLILVLIPGIIFYVTFFPAGYECILKKKGVVDSFQKSLYLTKDRKLTIAGIFGVYTIFFYVCYLVVQHYVPHYGTYLVTVFPTPFMHIVNYVVWKRLRSIKKK